jgi:cytochrome P450
MAKVIDFAYRLSMIAEEDPYPTYRWMRDHDPVHYSAPEDVWVLTRHDATGKRENRQADVQ